MNQAEEIAQEVLALLDEYGKTLTFIAVTPGAYNPTTGKTAAETLDSVDFKGVIMSYHWKAIDGTHILGTDKRCLIPAAEFVDYPKVDDRIVEGGTTWKILDVKTYEVADIPAVHIAQVRNAR